MYVCMYVERRISTCVAEYLFLQCLSNTSSLTKYFIGTKSGYKPYKKHINKDNPLGMGGAIAEAYGALLEDMWSGKVGCVAPRQFKVRSEVSLDRVES